MKRFRQIRGLWLLGIASIVMGSSARADQVWNVSLDTSQLATIYAGPFALDFELVGSDGNTVTLGNFAFGSGSSSGPAFLTGGASGDLGGSVTLDDSANFFSDFNQQFTPGLTLSFSVDTTLIAPPSGGIPDNFSMVILDGYDPAAGYDPSTGTGGTPIPTADPSGADTFFNFNINGPGQTTVASSPDTSGSITITITPAGVVPEPSSVTSLLAGVLWLSGAISWHRRRKRQGRSD